MKNDKNLMTMKTLTKQELEQLWKIADAKITESIQNLNVLYQTGNMSKKKYETERSLIYSYYRGVKDFYDSILVD